MKLTHFIVPFFIAFSLAVWGCDDGGSDSTQEPSSTDNEDTTQSGDDTDTELVTPYDDIDCDGKAADPLACESELCMNKNMYVRELEACTAAPNQTCEGTIACYDAYLVCMRVSCPPGTALPQTHDEKAAAGFYECDSTLADCNLANM